MAHMGKGMKYGKNVNGTAAAKKAGNMGYAKGMAKKAASKGYPKGMAKKAARRPVR